MEEINTFSKLLFEIRKSLYICCLLSFKFLLHLFRIFILKKRMEDNRIVGNLRMGIKILYIEKKIEH